MVRTLVTLGSAACWIKPQCWGTLVATLDQQMKKERAGCNRGLPRLSLTCCGVPPPAWSARCIQNSFIRPVMESVIC